MSNKLNFQKLRLKNKSLSKENKALKVQITDGINEIQKLKDDFNGLMCEYNHLKDRAGLFRDTAIAKSKDYQRLLKQKFSFFNFENFPYILGVLTLGVLLGNFISVFG